MVKNWSAHFIFDEDFQWKDLSKAFPEIWDIIVSQTKQSQEEMQYDQTSLELNLQEISNNKKPMGYFKDGAKIKLVFPSDRKEMIIYRGILTEEIHDLADKIQKVLKNKKIKYNVEYDKMLLYEIRRRRK
ncbi:MAG TPA: hypothetical protein VKU79_04540 [Thermoplasmataceae archaeon]|nr:hypothetical protein [Thermoplasmataceae archaeon]